MLLRCIQRPPKQMLSLSTAAAAELPKELDTFRTNELSPSNHTKIHFAKFYRQNPSLKKQLFAHGGLPKKFELQTKTFTECCLMVRKPALELMNYIQNSDLSKPTIRYVLYGKNGVGKSLTLANLIQYGHENGFILVHVPWVPDWFKKPKEKANSTSQEGFIDLPIDAAAWLVHFKIQNNTILEKLNLKCSKEYVWSKRETTPANAPLTELIEHGIARVKFSSDVISALLGELKLQSTEGKCKTMVAIDGYNSFFLPVTRILGERKVKITPNQITLTKPFLDITNYDWCNGVCILVVDQMAAIEGYDESDLPRYLLRKEGFEHLDPFVPIRVDNYNDQEFDSCIEYYLNRKWLQTNRDGFDKELKFLSGSNPYRLMELCKSL